MNKIDKAFGFKEERAELKRRIREQFSALNDTELKLAKIQEEEMLREIQLKLVKSYEEESL